MRLQEKFLKTSEPPNSRVNIWKKNNFNHQTIATKGILTEPGRVEASLKHIKSLSQSDLLRVFCQNGRQDDRQYLLMITTM